MNHNVVLTFRPLSSHTWLSNAGHWWPFIELCNIGLAARERLAGSLRQGRLLGCYLPTVYQERSIGQLLSRKEVVM